MRWTKNCREKNIKYNFSQRKYCKPRTILGCQMLERLLTWHMRRASIISVIYLSKCVLIPLYRNMSHFIIISRVVRAIRPITVITIIFDCKLLLLYQLNSPSHMHPPCNFDLKYLPIIIFRLILRHLSGLTICIFRWVGEVGLSPLKPSSRIGRNSHLRG